MPENIFKTWVCSMCGYIHYGPEPPDECPVCGASKDQFTLSTEEETPPAMEIPSVTVNKAVVVGAGIAGVSAAETLRKFAPQADITLISAETHLPYYRLNLTRYLAGEIHADQLSLHPEIWYNIHNIRLLRNTAAQALDLGNNELILSDESRIPFDRLVLTTGSRPFVPPFPGAGRKNVTTLRTRQDADFLLEACQGNRMCVCIGGGLLGLETAGALARRGAKVTVLENQAWLLPRQLNETASKRFQTLVQARGIAVRTKVNIRELAGDEAVQGVLLDDGTTLPADVVVISAGVRSNTDLARQAGLEVKQGILVDSTMKTSHPDIFSAGDAAECRGMLYGLWVPSQVQGTVAGMNAAGQVSEFTEIPRSATLKVLGIQLFNIGVISPDAATDRVFETEVDGNYYFFVFRDSLLVGSILLGDAVLSNKIKKVVEERQDCSGWLQEGYDAAHIMNFIKDLVVV
jgi:nitrite reductase (NADH) large subunit